MLYGRFVARITPKGERLFYFRYTDSDGKRIRLPLGAYHKEGLKGLTVKEARKRARGLSDLYISEIVDLREYLESRQASLNAQHKR